MAQKEKSRTADMVAFAEADGRMSPAKAMIEYFMMNLDAFPAAKKAFPGCVAIKYQRRLKNLKKELGEDVVAELNLDEVKAACEFEVLQEMFPAMPRVVAMKEAAPYVHSKMPAVAQLDINDNRVAERIMTAQARLAEHVLKLASDGRTQQPKEEPRDVTPAAAGPAAIIGRAGR